MTNWDELILRALPLEFESETGEPPYKLTEECIERFVQTGIFKRVEDKRVEEE